MACCTTSINVQTRGWHGRRKGFGGDHTPRKITLVHLEEPTNEWADPRRRGYYHATDARSSGWVEALQSDDKEFLSIASKANQLIFLR